MEYDTKTIILNNEGPIAGDKFTENKFTVKGEQKIIFDLKVKKKKRLLEWLYETLKACEVSSSPL